MLLSEYKFTMERNVFIQLYFSEVWLHQHNWMTFLCAVSELYYVMSSFEGTDTHLLVLFPEGNVSEIMCESQGMCPHWR